MLPSLSGAKGLWQVWRKKNLVANRNADIELKDQGYNGMFLLLLKIKIQTSSMEDYNLHASRMPTGYPSHTKRVGVVHLRHPTLPCTNWMCYGLFQWVVRTIAHGYYKDQQDHQLG